MSEKGPILSHDLKPGEGLKAALKNTRSGVIGLIRESGLKGRGAPVSNCS